MNKKNFRMLKSLIWIAIASSFMFWLADYTNQFYERLDAIIVAIIVSIIHYIYVIYFKKE